MSNKITKQFIEILNRYGENAFSFEEEQNTIQHISFRVHIQNKLMLEDIMNWAYNNHILMEEVIQKNEKN